ncbi:hypothetical protein ACQ7HM_21155 [Williamsia sp. MIQD14]|uniref:antitoxin VbhA family protein n=1 Tax=Williamsia sp. MIQD14 TaxID=3425703 RepID=UPI003DA07067
MTTMSLSPDVAALGWPSRYPELFADLTDAQARSVHNAIANGVLEGWEPTRADVAEQCDAAAGRIGIEEIVSRARGGAAARGHAS